LGNETEIKLYAAFLICVYNAPVTLGLAVGLTFDHRCKKNVDLKNKKR